MSEIYVVLCLAAGWLLIGFWAWWLVVSRGALITVGDLLMAFVAMLMGPLAMVFVLLEISDEWRWPNIVVFRRHKD